MFLLSAVISFAVLLAGSIATFSWRKWMERRGWRGLAVCCYYTFGAACGLGAYFLVTGTLGWRFDNLGLLTGLLLAALAHEYLRASMLAPYLTSDEEARVRELGQHGVRVASFEPRKATAYIPRWLRILPYAVAGAGLAGFAYLAAGLPPEPDLSKALYGLLATLVLGFALLELRLARNLGEAVDARSADPQRYFEQTERNRKFSVALVPLVQTLIGLAFALALLLTAVSLTGSRTAVPVPRMHGTGALVPVAVVVVIALAGATISLYRERVRKKSREAR